MNLPPTPVANVAIGELTRTDASWENALRKRWLLLLPAIFISYSLAYLDRSNFGFGVAAGLGRTLHISDKDVSLLAGLFFLGYFGFQVPGAMLARRYSMRRVICASLLLWGFFAACTGIIQRFWLLALDRFLLGVAESLVMPVMVHLLAQWFTRAERSRANAILILGNPLTLLIMSPVTGSLIEKLGWQMTFVVEGFPSMLWAIVWMFIVRDHPTQAPWIDAQAARSLENRLADEQTTLAPVTGLFKAFLRRDVVLLTIQYFFWSLGMYAFVLWLPTFVRNGTAASMARTGLLTAIPYFPGIAMMLIVSYFSDRTQKRTSLVWPFLLRCGPRARSFGCV